MAEFRNHDEWRFSISPRLGQNVSRRFAGAERSVESQRGSNTHSDTKKLSLPDSVMAAPNISCAT